MSGLVSLVGAGPGDPELLTLKAARRLAEADLVLYDALVEAETLDFAARARRFFVGKRAGRAAIHQDAINRLMIREARRGHRIVRLKCGDPFVFGRGGEEALALAAAGITCEVVPGVSSAIAAPLLAGIPVTHRGLSSAFVVVSGHAESAFAPVLGSVAPGSATLVILMGLRNREAIRAELLARGWPAATPAAIVLGASRPGAAAWHGTLDGLGAGTLETLGAGTLDALGAGAPDTERDLPGIIVVGAVVGLAGILSTADARQDPFSDGRFASAAT